MYHFTFENLEVYQKTITFTNKIFTLTKRWPNELIGELVLFSKMLSGLKKSLNQKP